jgi:hypothetical protein
MTESAALSPASHDARVRDILARSRAWQPGKPLLLDCKTNRGAIHNGFAQIIRSTSVHERNIINIFYNLHTLNC